MTVSTSLPVQPHLYIGDSAGRPLDNGKIFFGEPNKDPEFYPINIYYDKAMTIAAAQPVRTKGGFMDANGDMIEVYANELTYSVKVLDGYGIQVFYKPEMTRTNTDNLLTVKLPFASARERSQNEKNQEFLSIDDFNDLPDYSVAMQSWETELSGKTVDLKGKTLVSSYLPETIEFINGAVETGGKVVAQPLTAKAHPIAGNMGVILDDGITHFWCHEALHDLETGKTMLFVKHAYRHGASHTSPLVMYTSEDSGLSFKSAKSIYNRQDYDIAEVRGGVMANGRYGLFLTMRDLSMEYSNDFIYSDDKGATWTAIEDVCAGHFSYSNMMVSPSNPSTFYVYGYIGNNLQVAKTTNNGLTWTNTTVNLGIVVSEPSVVKLPNQNKWIMFIRTQTKTYISTSTNMDEWSTPTDANINLGQNPVQAIIENGKLYVYLFMRDFGATLSTENDVLLLIDDYDYVFNNKMMSNRNFIPVFTGIDRNLGYMRILKTNMGNIFTLNAGEYDYSTEKASSSKVLIGSNYGNYVPTPKPSKDNWFRNGRFDFWSRGTTATGSANFKSADGWWVNTSGSTVTASRAELPISISQSTSFRPKYGMRIQASIEDYVGLYQLDYSDTALQSTQSTSMTLQIWGTGDIPSDLEATYTQDFGTGGSEVVSKSGFKFDIGNVGTGKMWYGTAKLAIDSIVGKTIGTDAYFRLGISSRAVQAWDCVILGIHATTGHDITPYINHNKFVDAARCRQYIEVLDLRSNDVLCNAAMTAATTASGVVNYTPKVRAGTAYIINGAISLQFYPVQTGLSSVAFSSVGKNSALVTATTASSVEIGRGGAIRCKNTEASTILIDCE